jgi:hypothetical protein
MSSIGSPIDTSLLQTAQAQQSASKARDREKATSDGARRFQDMVELRVAGLETAEAVRRLPPNDSEQAESEHQAQGSPSPPPPPPEERPRIDLQA